MLLLSAGLVGGGLLFASGDRARTPVSAEASASPTAKPSPSARPSVVVESAVLEPAELARRLGPGVLRVEVKGCGQEASGTAFAIGPHHLVTNHHVVSVDPTPELVNRSGVRWQGRVIGWRESPDLAVVEVEERLPVWLPWADTVSLTEGQQLVALGYPVPEMAFSVTQADIVSFQTANGVRRAVRTDGALDRGNSGGPALTLKGEVAGVVTEMDAQEGFQLVALLYTADALRGDVEAILGSPTSVEPVCDAGPESLPEEWWDDYQDMPTPAVTYAYGDDATLDALQDACAGGDMAACDELYATSPYGSDYEAFAMTCGQRTDPAAGFCQEWQVEAQQVPEAEPDWEVEPEPQVAPEPEIAPVPDAVPEPPPSVEIQVTRLDELRAACGAGDSDACDTLYIESAPGSEDETFAATCGDRAEPQPATCAARLGSA